MKYIAIIIAVTIASLFVSCPPYESTLLEANYQSQRLESNKTRMYNTMLFLSEDHMCYSYFKEAIDEVHKTDLVLQGLSTSLNRYKEEIDDIKDNNFILPKWLGWISGIVIPLLITLGITLIVNARRIREESR